MQKGALIGVVAVVILAIGGYFLFNSKSQQKLPKTTDELTTVEPKNVDEKTPLSTETEGELSDVTVVYGPNGFSPATITINRGQKVIFKNESGKKMWVASDDHPSHLIYPEFDAKKGVETGSTYEFVFNKVGTWGYHNHLSPSSTGTVIVE